MAWTAGAALTAAQLNTYVPQTWTAYSPAVTPWTMSSSWFRYRLAGKTLDVEGMLVTATFPGGNLTVPLPSGLTGYLGGINEYRAVGTWQGLRATVSRYCGAAVLSTSQTGILFVINGSGALVGSGAPVTWVAGDVFNFSATLEIV